MPRPRWESGMPLEMPRGSRDRYSPVRGHDEMPAGVTARDVCRPAGARNA